MRIEIGQEGITAKEIPTLCCEHSIAAGAKVKIMRRTSHQLGRPRVVEVLVDDTCFHRVKLSKVWFT